MDTIRRVAVVGAGPAGLSVSAKLLHASSNVSVHLFESKRLSGGLLNYGVAPDSPDVRVHFKNY